MRIAVANVEFDDLTMQDAVERIIALSQRHDRARFVLGTGNVRSIPGDTGGATRSSFQTSTVPRTSCWPTACPLSGCRDWPPASIGSRRRLRGLVAGCASACREASCFGSWRGESGKIVGCGCFSLAARLAPHRPRRMPWNVDIRKHEFAEPTVHLMTLFTRMRYNSTYKI